MCGVLLILWVCIGGGIAALTQGEWTTGVGGIAAGLAILAYAALPSQRGRFTMRVAVVVLWFAGGLILWGWTVGDWAVALRIGFFVLGGGALIAYLLRGMVIGRRSARSRPPR